MKHTVEWHNEFKNKFNKKTPFHIQLCGVWILDVEIIQIQVFCFIYLYFWWWGGGGGGEVGGENERHWCKEMRKGHHVHKELENPDFSFVLIWCLFFNRSCKALHWYGCLVTYSCHIDFFVSILFFKLHSSGKEATKTIKTRKNLNSSYYEHTLMFALWGK